VTFTGGDLPRRDVGIIFMKDTLRTLLTYQAEICLVVGMVAGGISLGVYWVYGSLLAEWLAAGGVVVAIVSWLEWESIG
jgi:hypothetical protein